MPKALGKEFSVVNHCGLYNYIKVDNGAGKISGVWTRYLVEKWAAENPSVYQQCLDALNEADAKDNKILSR